MREMRSPKNWKIIRTDARPAEDKASRVRRENKLSKAIKTVYTMTEDELKNYSEKSYQEKIAEEDNLVKAYDEKKLKSKALIKEARAIKSRREKKNKKKAVVTT